MCFYKNCENPSIHTIILKNLIVWINMFQNIHLIHLIIIINNIVFFIFSCVGILVNTYLLKNEKKNNNNKNK